MVGVRYTEIGYIKLPLQWKGKLFLKIHLDWTNEAEARNADDASREVHDGASTWQA